jgi:hypothetical protein
MSTLWNELRTESAALRACQGRLGALRARIEAEGYRFIPFHVELAARDAAAGAMRLDELADSQVTQELMVRSASAMSQEVARLMGLGER